MAKHAAAVGLVGCKAFCAATARLTMVPLVGSLEFVFCFGGWTASCVSLFHVIVSIYGTETTEYLRCCVGMTAEETAAMRVVEAYMVLCGAVQMAAAAAAMTSTGRWRFLRRASAYVALAVAAATMWLWCLYLHLSPQLRCFRCFGVPARVAVVSVSIGLATPALILIPRGLLAVVRGDEHDWDD